MRERIRWLAIFLSIMSLAGCQSGPVPAQSSQSSPGDLPARSIHRRAVEAAIWGVPAVNFERLYDGLVDAKGDWNQIVYWSRLPDWKNQTLTPNPDVVYLMPFYDTRNGPVVMVIPPEWTRGRAGST